jgi:hypothetical protein
MNDTSVSAAQGALERPRWLLLIHQLAPKPDYVRVKVRRRLKQLGAAALKNTVYALPNSDESLEDFVWLVQEIEADGGSAMLCEATFVEGITNEEIDAMLEAERSDSAENPASAENPIQPGRTWVTREDVHIDRMASAWLIRRFIDPKAAFKFVPARGYKPQGGELRFDMFHAEYTHEADRCTFQTLVKRFALADRALQAIGEIVHDIDCKDEQFNRAETRGIATLVRGLAQTVADDSDRIKRATALFDDLYASFTNVRS